MSAQLLRKRHHTEVAAEPGEESNEALVRQKVADGEGRTVFKDYRALLERLSNSSDHIVDLLSSLVQTEAAAFELDSTAASESDFVELRSKQNELQNFISLLVKHSVYSPEKYANLLECLIGTTQVITFPNETRSLLASYLHQTRCRIIKICVVNVVKKDLSKEYPISLVKSILLRKQTDIERWCALIAYQYCDNSVIEKPIEKPPLLEFIKACLKHNPKDIESKIRRRALKVLFLRVETEVALKICRYVINDQDPSVRVAIFRLIADKLPSTYQQHKTLYDSISSQALDQNQMVRRFQLEFICQKLLQMSEGHPQTKLFSCDVVQLLCTDIRAMDKKMRIFCAEMLIKISGQVGTNVAIQMMQKESMFENKFVQVGVTSSKPKAALEVVEQKGEMLDASVTGILLMMLEDDSMAVRIAGIKAMSCYGRQCEEIRKSCLTFLIDMLNDDINDVRIGALHGIQTFNKVLTLDDYAVDTVLFNLNEDNPRLRQEIYKFFAATTVNSGALFQKILDKLFSNLVKYEHQGETEKIYTLCAQLGRSQSRIVGSIYLKILSIDKRFLAKEPEWTDQVYVAKMILIYAASESQKNILTEAPSFFGKHLGYFKDKFPNYFKNQSQDKSASLEEQLIAEASEKILHKIRALYLMPNPPLDQILVLTQNSFKQLTKVSNDPQQDHNSDRSVLSQLTEGNRIDCILGFIHLFTAFAKQARSLTLDPILAIKAKFKLLAHFETNEELRNQIQGLMIVPHCRILMKQLCQDQSTFNQKVFVESCHSLASMSFAHISLQNYLHGLITNQGILLISENRPQVVKEIQNAIPKIEIRLPIEFPQYRRFEIIEPKSNTPFKPIKFSSKLSEFMQFKAYGSHNVSSTEQFKIVVEYPDKTSTVTNVQLQETEKGTFVNQVVELRQNVAWSEPGPIVMYIGIAVQNTVASDEVRVLRLKNETSSFVVVSNIKKCYIKPF